MPKVYDDSMGPIGAIVSSMLTLAQFQNLYGTGWVLMDGGSCAGSKYASVTGATTLPDARGMVLRGKNNGRVDTYQNPDGDVALGTYQGDVNKSHNHYSFDSDIDPHDGNTNWVLSNSAQSGNFRGGFVGGGTRPMVTSTDGGNETRMRNITVNHFIRIN